MQNLCTIWSQCRAGLEADGAGIASLISYYFLQCPAQELLVAKSLLCRAIDVLLFWCIGDKDESDFLILLFSSCCQWWIKCCSKLISHNVFGLGPGSCRCVLCTWARQICYPGDRVTAPKAAVKCNLDWTQGSRSGHLQEGAPKKVTGSTWVIPSSLKNSKHPAWLHVGAYMWQIWETWLWHWSFTVMESG